METMICGCKPSKSGWKCPDCRIQGLLRPCLPSPSTRIRAPLKLPPLRLDGLGHSSCNYAGHRFKLRGQGLRKSSACGDGSPVGAPRQMKGAAEAAPSRIPFGRPDQNEKDRPTLATFLLPLRSGRSSATVAVASVSSRTCPIWAIPRSPTAICGTCPNPATSLAPPPRS